GRRRSVRPRRHRRRARALRAHPRSRRSEGHGRRLRSRRGRRRQRRMPLIYYSQKSSRHATISRNVDQRAKRVAGAEGRSPRLRPQAARIADVLALLAVALSARVARAEEPATPFEAHVRGERGHAAARDRTAASWVVRREELEKPGAGSDDALE